MSLPWKVAGSGRFIKTEAIKVMKGATAVRKPLQRSSTRYTGKRMDERIGSSAANVESAMIQVVGQVCKQECVSCQKRDGPWAQCIRFHELGRTVSSFGNCHWNGQHRGNVTITRHLFHRPQLQPTDAIVLRPIPFTSTTTTLPKRHVRECGRPKRSSRWFGVSRLR